MKTVKLVQFTKWAGSESAEYALLYNTKLENMSAAFIYDDGVGDSTAIACPAEWKEIDTSDLPEDLDYDEVVYALEGAAETIMLEGEDAVDWADDEEWICDFAGCEMDGKKVGNRVDGCAEVAAHFTEHDRKPIVLLSFDFFRKSVQYIYAVVPKDWDCREADMILSGYQDDDWNGSMNWLKEHGYFA